MILNDYVTENVLKDFRAGSPPALWFFWHSFACLSDWTTDRWEESILECWMTKEFRKNESRKMIFNYLRCKFNSFHNPFHNDSILTTSQSNDIVWNHDVSSLPLPILTPSHHPAPLSTSPPTLTNVTTPFTTNDERRTMNDGRRTMNATPIRPSYSQ